MAFLPLRQRVSSPPHHYFLRRAATYLHHINARLRHRDTLLAIHASTANDHAGQVVHPCQCSIAAANHDCAIARRHLHVVRFLLRHGLHADDGAVPYYVGEVLPAGGPFVMAHGRIRHIQGGTFVDVIKGLFINHGRDETLRSNGGEPSADGKSETRDIYY